MSQIADNLAVAFPRVAVPRPIPGMVTENVLVMTYLPGGSLLDAIKRMAQVFAIELPCVLVLSTQSRCRRPWTRRMRTHRGSPWRI